MYLTFIAVFLVDLEVKIGAISESRYGDDFTFEVPDISMRTIDSYTLGFLLRFELEVHV